jgi:hypothetical protein
MPAEKHEDRLVNCRLFSSNCITTIITCRHILVALSGVKSHENPLFLELYKETDRQGAILHHLDAKGPRRVCRKVVSFLSHHLTLFFPCSQPVPVAELLWTWSSGTFSSLKHAADRSVRSCHYTEQVSLRQSEPLVGHSSGIGGRTSCFVQSSSRKQRKNRNFPKIMLT